MNCVTSHTAKQLKKFVWLGCITGSSSRKSQAQKLISQNVLRWVDYCLLQWLEKNAEEDSSQLSKSLVKRNLWLTSSVMNSHLHTVHKNIMLKLFSFYIAELLSQRTSSFIWTKIEWVTHYTLILTDPSLSPACPLRGDDSGNQHSFKH